MRRSVILPLCLVAAVARGQDTIRVRGQQVSWTAPTIPLTKVATLGQLDGPPEYAFGGVDRIAVDARGVTYVYDYKAAQIRQYDRNGKYIRAIGRKGAGPGEYQSIIALGIVRDSLFAVFDASNKRMTVFAPDGKLVSTVQQSRLAGFNDGAAALRDGRFIFRVRPTINGREGEIPIEPPPGMVIPPSFVLQAGADGSIVDSMPIGSKTKFGRAFYLTGSSGGNFNFVPEFHVALSPRGSVVWGESDQYRIFIRDSARVRVIEQPWTPLPVVDGERANWQAYADFFEKRSNGRFTYPIPKTKPAFRDLQVDQDGRIWLSLYAPAEERDIPPRQDQPVLRWRQNAVYDVFGPEGNHLGRVALPPNSRMIWAQGDRIWSLGKGPDDEDLIVTYRFTIASDRRR
jgi:hypothetical protein